MANKNKVRKNKACSQKMHKNTSNNKTVQSEKIKIKSGFIETYWYKLKSDVIESDSPYTVLWDLFEGSQGKPLVDKGSLIRIMLDKQTDKWIIVDMKHHSLIPTPFTKNQIEQAQNRAELIYIINR